MSDVGRKKEGLSPRAAVAEALAGQGFVEAFKRHIGKMSLGSARGSRAGDGGLAIGFAQIKRLGPEEQVGVIRFAYQLSRLPGRMSTFD